MLIPAITIWQPWASLIAIGAKPFEFRKWAAPVAYRGRRIAIHAGARPAKLAEIRELIVRLNTSKWRETGLDREKALPLLEGAARDPKGMWHSAVTCIATLGKPLRDAELFAAMGVDGPVNDSDRDEHSNWGWPLTDITPLEPPRPAVGSQGFWQFQVPEGVS
jgi:hypothetical protein